MQQELKELESYTNSRGLLPGLAHVHVTKDGAAFAGDGDVELYIPKSSLPAGPWSANAAQLVNMVKVAGDDAVIALDGESVLVTSKDFTGKVQMAAEDASVVSLQSQYVEKGTPEVMKLPHPHAFSEALRRVAPFASTDNSGGGHWTGLLIRGDKALVASNQGFHVVQAVFDKPFRKAGGADILVPARAALAAANAGAVVSMEVNDAQGIGLFMLENGHVVLFRLLTGPTVNGKVAAFPDVDEPLDNNMPEDGLFAASDALLPTVQRVAVAASAKDPRIALEFDDSGWFLSCSGNGEASISLEKFAPAEGAQAVVLSPPLWELVLTHASEVAPVADLWFRSRFNIEHEKAAQSFLLRGFMSGMSYTAEETQPASVKPEKKAAKEKAPAKPKATKAKA
jgi:hypothetical protein